MNVRYYFINVLVLSNFNSIEAVQIKNHLKQVFIGLLPLSKKIISIIQLLKGISK